ncbi:hypothetical protein [Desulfogranum mediterraneum]|uniref:hypothetical protein n=1 Tax=Desulfogranum mediterraneum TaxID=160661 RepID=UPI0004122796|nr:hypothetical protein [Desulfogranum mediterraneum]
MTTQHSFTKFEKEVLPKFRRDMNLAESTEDVKKFFSYAMQELLAQVFSGKYTPRYEDICLQAGQDAPFLLSEAVRQLDDYPSIWDNSDLEEIILRFANMASHRYHHLAKKPEKTESKIRM